MLLTLRKLPVMGLSFIHIITSNMRDIHTERSDNLLLTFYHRGLLRFFFHSTLKKNKGGISNVKLPYNTFSK
jgi:hypothetical protein